MCANASALSSCPLIRSSSAEKVSRGKQFELQKLYKTAEHFVQKLKNIKNAGRLITCEFDQQLLQIPGLMGSLMPRLELLWQSSSISPNDSNMTELESNVISQLPALINPTAPAQSGALGSVPLSHTFTWKRYVPRIDNSVSNSEQNSPGPKIVLDTVIEPEVVLLLTTEQFKGLLTKPTGRKAQETPSTLFAFGSCLQALNRPVSVILLTSGRIRQSDKKRSSIGSPSASTRLSVNQFCAELQLNFDVRATRICSNIHDVGLVLGAYTRSIAERHMKTGRLTRDEGLTFLPDTVRMGLAGCASRGRGPGPAPRQDGDGPGDSAQATHAWANRVWLAQLGQWRGLTGEIAHAVTLTYPTARSFFQACRDREQRNHESVHLFHNEQSEANKKKRPHPFESELADLDVRRGAGVLATRRKLGPEFARRLITHFTSTDPDEIIE
ncbi:unnamed protein product [Calicophoron daubneyi]|uniref:Crossover junction endonuclease EME1 n=1 Tax=Calicophoron daubneyi TaxID=300641 RepID=A0AAV2TQW5_CALDB